MVYGYIRTSSKDQNLDRQRIALRDLVDPANIYSDQQSGANFNRPGWQALLTKLERGDLLYLKSIDRLGRSYQEILVVWNELTKVKGIDIKVLDMPLLDTTRYKDLLGSFVSDLVLQILSFQAEQERTFIKQRQAEGIAAAHEKGVKFGRSKKKLPPNFDELYTRFSAGEPISQLAKECDDMSESTLRLRLYEHRDKLEGKTV